MGVVTNAHVVKDGVVIKLIRLDSTKKYKATVLCFAVDIDLALLEVEDAGFWKNVEPIELGTVLPELFTDVMVRCGLHPRQFLSFSSCSGGGPRPCDRDLALSRPVCPMSPDVIAHPHTNQPMCSPAPRSRFRLLDFLGAGGKSA